MFARERREKISELTEKQGQVLVKDLADRFKVTLDCIRKDLAALEAEGKLSRTYGGAVKNRTNPHLFNVSQRLDQNTEAKRIIASKALRLITNGDTVFLDISTVNAFLAPLIAGSSLKVTVITNMVEAMLGFGRAGDTGAELVFIGGLFTPGRDGFTGAEAAAAISRYRFDKAFMGAAGIDPYRGRAETYLAADGVTKEAALGSSRKKYLLLEARKFGDEAPYAYARLEDFTGIITGGPVPPGIRRALGKYKLEII
ncbi:MAG: DeoR/GlpR family DNA-binding transcription regulator [Treponema sp.]|jgi:DeoR family glycerol-3-phosphate regulon repressor|nr:DeoR/GlpR family DNA-binding transcription regulator [Treponema sp.]